MVCWAFNERGPQPWALYGSPISRPAVYLKTYPLQVVQGRLFGMGQSKAHLWMHVLWVVLRAALRALGEAPT